MRASARARARASPASASDHGPYGGRLSLSIARPVTITAPRRRDSGSSCRTSVDLPTPASPMIMRVCGPPCTLWSSASTSERSSVARPTKRLKTSCGDDSFSAPAMTTLSRPSRFASNSARSAAVNSASNDSPFSGAVATPIESVTDIVRSGVSRSGIGMPRVVVRAPLRPARCAPRGIEARQQHDELVARVAAHVLAGPQQVAHDARHQAQRVVAGEMAEGVVHRLELIDVDDEQRHLRAGATALGEHGGRHVHERAPHERAREIVLLGDHHRVLRAGATQRRTTAAWPMARSPYRDAPAPRTAGEELRIELAARSRGA